jgi:S1-C subfamily serine protease
VALVAALVGAGIGAAAGAGVAATIHSGTTTVVKFSPNTSVFRRMGGVKSILTRVLPSVVAIQASGPGCSSESLGGSGPELDDGTGMILTPNGEILTNNHVIADATQIRVTLYGQTKAYPATLVGTDPTYDVALLQMRGASGLPTVALGQSSRIAVGDDVLAIGNALALSQSTPSVTEGIISAEGRSIQAGGGCGGAESLNGLLQTQAPINAGNSGGPLVNSAGQVIGMNTAAATSPSGNAPAQNIGFAIPIDSVRTLLPGLRKGGTIGPPKAFMGVEVVSVTSAERSAFGLTPRSGALVVSVVTGTPASQAGIRPDDVIVRFAGHLITTDASLTVAVRAARPGERVDVELYRGPTLMLVSLVLGTKPAAA